MTAWIDVSPKDLCTNQYTAENAGSSNQQDNTHIHDGIALLFSTVMSCKNGSHVRMVSKRENVEPTTVCHNNSVRTLRSHSIDQSGSIPVDQKRGPIIALGRPRLEEDQAHFRRTWKEKVAVLMSAHCHTSTRVEILQSSRQVHKRVVEHILHQRLVALLRSSSLDRFQRRNDIG
jgi:hypothetical protein